jgi:2-polyprenyl-3-methyl-5-hydroxy-6-metoxy-1,4-benzoquinol methylase
MALGQRMDRTHKLDDDGCSSLPDDPSLMPWQPLAERNRQPEWMDQPGLDVAAHDQALQGLRRINTISGAVGCLFTPVQALAAALDHSRPLRILDVACGGGDNTIALAERCRRNGLAVQVDGCDRSEQAVTIASRQAAARPLGSTFFQADVLVDPLPAGYDVMVCSLFLHHLEGADAVELLRRLGRSCRHLVLVNDLIRSPLGYGLAWVGCRLLSRSPIVHFDGPVSVQGAFRMDEALDLAGRAGLGGARIQRHWPERFLLSWRRPDGAVEPR